MPFWGTLSKSVLDIAVESIMTWRAPAVYVGCSGNFTTERALANAGQKQIFSNDVTLYSSALGCYFARQPLSYELGEKQPFTWLSDFVATEDDRMASVMLTTQLLPFITTKGALHDNAYVRRMVAEYERRWSDLHRKTKERLQATRDKLHLAGYAAQDMRVWLDTVPTDAAVVAYPPFIGHGDDQKYQGDADKLESVFVWDRPEYGMLGAEDEFKVFDDMATKRYWLFLSNQPADKYEPYQVGFCQLTNRASSVYVYASSGTDRVVAPRQKQEAYKALRLMPGEEIGQRLSIAIISYAQFCGLRSQYMNAGIVPGQASLCLAVLVDDRLVGSFALSFSPSSNRYHSPLSSYLLSDFPVDNTDYPRLAKLVLHAALSRESKLLIERHAHRRVNHLLTTALTHRPVSMKYRGLFELVSRKDLDERKKNRYNPSGVESKFELQYKAHLGQWSLAEGMALWQKKHGQRVEHADQDHSD